MQVCKIYLLVIWELQFMIIYNRKVILPTLYLHYTIAKEDVGA